MIHKISNIEVKADKKSMEEIAGVFLDLASRIYSEDKRRKKQKRKKEFLTGRKEKESYEG